MRYFKLNDQALSACLEAGLQFQKLDLHGETICAFVGTQADKVADFEGAFELEESNPEDYNYL